MPSNPRPDQPIPVPEPDVVRPPTPSEEPQPEKGPRLAATRSRRCSRNPTSLRRSPHKRLTRTSSLKANETSQTQSAISLLNACTHGACGRSSAIPATGSTACSGRLIVRATRSHPFKRGTRRWRPSWRARTRILRRARRMHLATLGPGASHLITGLYDGRLDHQPVLAIVGQQSRDAIGGHYQQEVIW